jgi:hypothetical protein
MRSSYFAKQIVLSVLMMLALTAVGCVRTTHPILKDEQVTSNDALLGKWVSKDGKLSAELHPGDDGKYKLAYTDQNGKKGDFVVRFGKIGDVSVAELSADAFTDDMADEYKSLLLPMYTMVVISKTQPQLELTGPSIDWLKKYVQAHPNELDVNNPDDPIVQASTDDFQAFFLKHMKDDGMLGEPAIFVRPGDPAAQPTAPK